MLPEGWRRATLDECVDLLTGYAFSSTDYVEPSESSIRLLRGDNIVPGSLRWGDAKHFPQQHARNLVRYELREGDVVIALDRPVVGAGLKCCTVKRDDLPCVLVQRVARLRASGNIDQNYLAQVMRTSTFVSHLLNHKTESAVPHISPNDIRNYPVALPQVHEQRWISNALQTWDDAIDITEALLANSRRQKKALIQLLLLGPSANWKSVRLSRIAERVQRQTDGQNYPVLMISSGSGFVRQDEKYSRFMAGKSLNDYVLLERGEFAYNKGNSKIYEFGCVFPLGSYTHGLVPHVYVCFRMNAECDPSFFKHLFEADYLHDQLGALVNTGVRNNGLLNIRPSDFMNVRVPLPPLSEQRSIAVILETATQEINTRQIDIEALREQKRALMQQLLTGKCRVRIHKTEAEASPS